MSTIMEEQSVIREFYKGKNVFLTGGTGFLGKAIIAKLLKSCPEIGKIYILIRAKKGSEGKARLETLAQCPLFDPVKAERPDFITHLEAVRGDIMLPGLGISDEQVQLLTEEVNVVIHSAATVRFDEPIKFAVKVNVEGTKKVMELSKMIKNLKSVVHISTAYANCDLDKIEEKLYPSNMDPDAAIAAFESMTDELALEISPKCLDQKPNTYTYTKQLAEKLVDKYKNVIPVCIVRPSIVVATYEDPFPGYVDNLFGPTGILVAGAKGAMRTILADPDKRLDCVPLDCVVNLIVTTAWKTASEHEKKLQVTQEEEEKQMSVYQCCSGKENPFYLSKTVPYALDAFEDYPFNEILWYPTYAMLTNPIIYFILDLLTHWVPALILDAKAKLCGEKPIMMFAQRKIKTGVLALRTFCLREYDFTMENTQALYKELNEADKETFKFNVKAVDWKLFMRHYIYGIRKYVMKEEDKDLDKARKNLKKMHFLHRVFCFALVLGTSLLMAVLSARALGLGVTPEISVPTNLMVEQPAAQLFNSSF